MVNFFPHVCACARQDMAVDLSDFDLWCPDAAWLKIFLVEPTKCCSVHSKSFKGLAEVFPKEEFHNMKSDELD